MVSPLANAPYVYGLLAHQDVIIIIPTIFLISFQPDERNQVQMTHRVVQCNDTNFVLFYIIQCIHTDASLIGINIKRVESKHIIYNTIFKLFIFCILILCSNAISHTYLHTKQNVDNSSIDACIIRGGHVK